MASGCEVWREVWRGGGTVARGMVVGCGGRCGVRGNVECGAGW